MKLLMTTWDGKFNVIPKAPKLNAGDYFVSTDEFGISLGTVARDRTIVWIVPSKRGPAWKSDKTIEQYYKDTYVRVLHVLKEGESVTLTKE